MFSKISMLRLHHQLYAITVMRLLLLDIQGTVKHSLRGVSNQDGNCLEDGRCLTNKVHRSDICSQF